MMRTYGRGASAAAILLACLGLGCSDDLAKTAAGSGGAAASGGQSGFGGGAGAPPNTGLGGADCPDLSCLACSSGKECGSSGAEIDGTCCRVGDALVHVAQGIGSEVVDIESDSTRERGPGAWSISATQRNLVPCGRTGRGPNALRQRPAQARRSG